jgi:hypothetical protein
VFAPLQPERDELLRAVVFDAGGAEPVTEKATATLPVFSLQ